jgi:nitroimidazol reductase NimA-like FMN-containing flavoprotein (pyridoxamine 5'-phosphate oxidase superfamily)
MKFHLRRVDREIEDTKALKQILHYSKHFILSLADGGEPYAVPLGYVYDEKENAAYFHCAKDGKKIEFIKRNPRAWGLVVVDKGIIEGACVNMYASAMFSGRVEFVENTSEKIKIMNLFAERLSSDVEGIKSRVQKLFGGDGSALGNVIFGKIKLEELTGKRSTEMSIEKLLKITGE